MEFSMDKSVEKSTEKKIKPFRKYCIELLTGHINLSRLTFAKVWLIDMTISTDILEMGLEPMTLGLLDLRSNRLSYTSVSF